MAPDGSIYVSDTSGLGKIVQEASQTVATTIVGQQLSRASQILEDTDGSLLLAIYDMDRIVRYRTNGVMPLVGGGPPYCVDRDGAGSNDGFNWPRGLALDTARRIFVADAKNHRISPSQAAGGLALQVETYPGQTYAVRTSADPVLGPWSTLQILTNAPGTAAIGLPLSGVPSAGFVRAAPSQ